MIPQDKFGRQIYPKLFKVLQESGRLLEGAGYTESTRKANLFFRKIKKAVFFADLRGTEDVPIWEDTRPLFYWRFEDDVPNWQRRRLIKNELRKLFKNKCPSRLSFYIYSAHEFESTSVHIDDGQGVYIWNDGFCMVCKKDFGGEGSFCSEDCRVRYESSLRKECKVCKVVVHSWDEWDSVEPLSELCPVCGENMCIHTSIEHHVSYFPERTIFVHRGCHNRIHRTNHFSQLKPDQKDIDKFYGKD